MNTEMILGRARLLLDQGRTNDAIKEVKQVLHQDPENDGALSLYARYTTLREVFIEMSKKKNIWNYIS